MGTDTEELTEIDELQGLKDSIDDATIYIDDAIESILEALDDGDGIPLPSDITALRDSAQEAIGGLNQLLELADRLSQERVKIV